MQHSPYEIIQLTLLDTIECWYSYEDYALFKNPDIIYSKQYYETLFGQL